LFNIPTILITLFLIAGIYFVFSPAMTYDFVYYDEQLQIISNPLAKSLQWQNIVDIFSSFCICSYYPIRLLSFAIDYHFWGNNPKGYHITNIVIHTINVVLLFYLLVRLSKLQQTHSLSNLRQSHYNNMFLVVIFGAILVFAIHPVVVEPVVWIGGREELLMMLFAFGAMHSWLSQHNNRFKPFTYSITFMFCVLSCLSSIFGCLIPSVLLAFEIIFRKNQSLTRIFLKILPMFFIGGISIVLKEIGYIIFANSNLQIPSETSINNTNSVAEQAVSSIFIQRILIVFSTYWLNLKTLIWPTKLTLIYNKFIPENIYSTEVIMGLLGIIFIFVYAYLVRKNKIQLFGIFWFIIGLLPSSQIVPNHIPRADRFLYFSVAGLTMIFSPMFASLNRLYGKIVFVIFIFILCALGLLTGRQITTWYDSISVFKHCLNINKNDYTAFCNLGLYLHDFGDISQAEKYIKTAIRLKPDSDSAYNTLGKILYRKKDYYKSIEAFLRALDLSPEDTQIRTRLSMVLTETGNYKEALRHLQEALSIDPNNSNVHDCMGAVFVERKDYEKAIHHFQKATKLDPHNHSAHHNLAYALAKQETIVEKGEETTK